MFYETLVNQDISAKFMSLTPFIYVFITLFVFNSAFMPLGNASNVLSRRGYYYNLVQNTVYSSVQKQIIGQVYFISLSVLNFINNSSS